MNLRQPQSPAQRPRGSASVGALFAASLGFTLLGLTSCGPPRNLDAIRSEVLKADPDFTSVMEKRDELANRITLTERNLALKKSQIEHQIAQLKQEIEDVSAKAKKDIEKTKALLSPDAERVHLALSMATQERKAKQGQRVVLGRSISRIEKAMKQGGTEWAEADRTRMQKELRDLRDEIKRLDVEIAGLNEHLRLLKNKELLLQL